MIAKLRNIYWKYGPVLLLIIWFLLIAASWTLYIFELISIKYALITSIGGIILLYVIYATRKSSNAVVNYEADNAAVEPAFTPSIGTARNIQRYLDILFFGGSIVLLLILQFTSSRPTVYFILTGILAGLLSFSILISSERIKVSWHIIKIFILSAITTLSSFKYYYWHGNDTWYHALMNEVIAKTGTLSFFPGKEVDYPLQHIAVALTDIVSAVDIRIASIIAVTLPSIAVSLVVFLIIRKSVGNKYALIAFLLANVFGHIITWRILAQTTSYGVLVTCVLMLAYFGWLTNSDKNGIRYALLYIVMFVSLILAHQFSTFIILIILFGCWLGSLLTDKKVYTKSMFIFFISLVCMILYWFIAVFGFQSSIEIFFSRAESVAEVAPNIDLYINITEPNVLVSLLNGNEILYVCIILLLVYFSMKYAAPSMRKKNNLLHIIAGALLITVVAFFLSIFFYSGMAHRFLPYLELLATLGLAYVIYIYLHSTKRNNFHWKAVCMIVVAVSFLAFVNVSYSEIAADNPIWVKEIYTSHSFTTAEITGLTTVTENLPTFYSTIQYDQALNRPLLASLYRSGLEQQMDRGNINSAQWSTYQEYSGEYLIFRETLLKTPTYQYDTYGSGKKITQLIQLETLYQQELDADCSRLYDNAEVVWYWIC